MVRLTSFIYCLNAERIVLKDGKQDGINAMRVLSTLMPEFIPSAFSFSIVFSILGADLTKENKIQVIFKKEDGAILLDTEEIVLPPNIVEKDTTKIPEEYVGFDLSMDFRNVIFESEGVYCTDIYFNGELLDTNNIYVRSRK
ncbi:MAG: hypothetical protein R3Y24_09420 [Eubacteriales bacterium]